MSDWQLLGANAEQVSAEALKTAKSIGAAVTIISPATAQSGFALASRVGSLLAILCEPLTEHDAVLVSPQKGVDVARFNLGLEPLRDFVIQSAFELPEQVQWIGSQSTEPSAIWALPAAREELPLLAPRSPGRQRDWLRHHIGQVPWSKWRLPASTERTALWAGIWQMNDLLDESHEQSQQIEGEGIDRNGDYWHAIMHRREPDFGNSKYWFRRVGSHPIFESLPELAAHVFRTCASAEASRWQDRLSPRGRWDAFAFVDLCEACARQESTPLGLAARQLQRAEMRLLIEHSWLTAQPDPAFSEGPAING